MTRSMQNIQTNRDILTERMESGMAFENWDFLSESGKVDTNSSSVTRYPDLFSEFQYDLTCLCPQEPVSGR